MPATTGSSPAYFRGLAEALVANILFQAGLFFSARVEGTTGAVLGLVWGALIAAVLVVRLRYLLHYAVLEAALEAASTGSALKDTATGTAYCPSCEMPLLVGANFCVVCGTSVRAGNKITRARNRTEDVDPATAPPPKPSLKPTPAGVAPQDNKTTALVVLAVVSAILIGGVLGQVAASVAADEVDEKPPADTGITIDPDAGDDELGRAPAVRLGDERRGRGPEPPGRRLGQDPRPRRRRTDAGAQGLPDRRAGPGLRPGLRVQGLLLRLPDAEEVHAAQADHQQPDRHPEHGRRGPRVHPAPGPPGRGLRGAATLNFRGLLATQQGGTIPVEGFAYYFIRPNGTGATAFALYGKGSLKPKSKLVTGYNTMLNTLVSTL